MVGRTLARGLLRTLARGLLGFQEELLDETEVVDSRAVTGKRP